MWVERSISHSSTKTKSTSQSNEHRRSQLRNSHRICTLGEDLTQSGLHYITPIWTPWSIMRQPAIFRLQNKHENCSSLQLRSQIYCLTSRTPDQVNTKQSMKKPKGNSTHKEIQVTSCQKSRIVKTRKRRTISQDPGTTKATSPRQQETLIQVIRMKNRTLDKVWPPEIWTNSTVLLTDQTIGEMRLMHPTQNRHTLRIQDREPTSHTRRRVTT